MHLILIFINIQYDIRIRMKQCNDHIVGRRTVSIVIRMHKNTTSNLRGFSRVAKFVRAKLSVDCINGNILWIWTVTIVEKVAVWLKLSTLVLYLWLRCTPRVPIFIYLGTKFLVYPYSMMPLETSFTYVVFFPTFMLNWSIICVGLQWVRKISYHNVM